MIWKHSEITLNTEIDSKQTEIDFATPPSSQLCLFLSLLIVAAGNDVVLSDRQVALTVAREDNIHTHTHISLPNETPPAVMTERIMVQDKTPSQTRLQPQC